MGTSESIDIVSNGMRAQGSGRYANANGSVLSIDTKSGFAKVRRWRVNYGSNMKERFTT